MRSFVFVSVRPSGKGELQSRLAGSELMAIGGKCKILSMQQRSAVRLLLNFCSNL